MAGSWSGAFTSEPEVVWIHGDLAPSLGPGAGSISDWVQGGGCAVLSLAGVTVAGALGAPAPAPVAAGPERWRHADDPLWSDAFRTWPDYPHIRGLQGWGAHPLFRSLPRGAYTWAATEGEPGTGWVFLKPDWPDAGRVIAVERAYVQLNADVAVAWEYQVGRGRLLCLGAHLRFGVADRRYDVHRDQVLRNALDDAIAHRQRAAATAEPRRACWPLARRQHAAVTVVPRPRALPPDDGRARSAPSVRSSSPDESPFTLAGAAALVVGSEARGVEEVWLHPLCVLSDVTVRIGGAAPRCREAVATPGALTRELEGRGGRLVTERVVVDPCRPEVHIQLLAAGGGMLPDEVEWQCRLPLRLEWPMPVSALVPMRVERATDGARSVMLVTGRDGAHVSALYVDGGDAPVVLEEDDHGSLLRIRASDPAGLRLAIVATTEGALGLPAPDTCSTIAQRHTDRLTAALDRATRVTIGDPLVDSAWPWAVSRLVGFRADGPYGPGMMAGHAASRPGWGRSRPGYAWFFGRDTCWSVDALLALGLHEEARDALDLLVATVDISGKVAHEITTSGVVHYDAADATPLLLRAVGAYTEWTGDLATLRRWWPVVLRAFDFCVSCDRDGDGLPENTDVGHGWVEMGPLAGGAITAYTAAIWIDALRRLSSTAHAVGDRDLAERVTGFRRRAEAGLEHLRDPRTGRLALHRTREGRLATDLTALSAVPIALGVDTSPSADEILGALAEPRFTASWGLRMLPTDDPRHDPAAYHAGTVWPLFSGWAALADARRGAVDRAWARVRSIAMPTPDGCKGGFAEVLHGETGRLAGVCSNQAWSAAMLVTPVITGLLGVRPDAMSASCALHPRVPRGVTHVAVDRLRIGDRQLALVCQRLGDGVELQLGAPLDNPGVLAIDVRGERHTLPPGADLSVSLGAAR